MTTPTTTDITYVPSYSTLLDPLGNPILVEDIFVSGEGVGDLHYEDGVYLHATFHDEQFPMRFDHAYAAKAWIAEHQGWLLP